MPHVRSPLHTAAAIGMGFVLVSINGGRVLAAPMDSSGTAAEAPDTSELAQGMDAWEQRDWDGVVLHLSAVVAREPGADMTWTRLGYAYRRLGLYDKSLAAYGKALAVNPSNRGALEYLGEAYLQMGKVDEAREVALKLTSECLKASPSAAPGKFPEGCEEMALLKKNFEALGLKLGS